MTYMPIDSSGNSTLANCNPHQAPFTPFQETPKFVIHSWPWSQVTRSIALTLLEKLGSHTHHTQSIPKLKGDSYCLLFMEKPIVIRVACRLLPPQGCICVCLCARKCKVWHSVNIKACLLDSICCLPKLLECACNVCWNHEYQYGTACHP